jgi:hypothetical protein
MTPALRAAGWRSARIAYAAGSLRLSP